MTAAAAMMHMPPQAHDEHSGMTRLCRNWLGEQGRPADAPAARLETLLPAFRNGRGDLAGTLLDLVAVDPRLMGQVADACLEWMREAGTLRSNPRLALEMMTMRRLFREAVAERNAPPEPSRMMDAATADTVTTGIRALVATALADMAEQLRGAWLLERQCTTLPRWRHWDIMLEVRPGVLLGETDVPERVAALMETARRRLERIWLADGTLGVHAYPVHASRSLLNHMREHGIVILGADMVAESPASMLRPSLTDDSGEPLLSSMADASFPPAHGYLPEEAPAPRTEIPEAEERAAPGHPSPLSADTKKDETGLLDAWLAPLRARLPMPVSDMLREGRRHAMLMGLSLLPAFIAWQVLMPDPTRSRIAAFEETHAQLVAARPWRQEEGADALDPLKTLEAYRGALRDFDATPSLPIYTDETRQYLLGRFRSRLGMEQEWQALFGCSDPRISFRNDLAVVQFRETTAACAPFFFRKENGRWRLDMKARESLITEGPKGTWEWRAGAPPETWRFAFAPLPAGEYEPGP